MGQPHGPRPRHAATVLACFVPALVVSGAARAACDAEPFSGVPRSVISEQSWVNGLSLSIAELPSLDASEARDRFVDYWRRANAPARTKSSDGMEITSVLKGPCLYSLQSPSGGGPGPAARYVVSDLRRPLPSLPREFDWPPASEADVLTDTVSDDGGRLSRMLSYRVEASSKLALRECVRRLTQAAWRLEALTQINEQHYVFHGRKSHVGLDVTIVRDGSGSVVTLNFAQSDG